MPQLLLILGSAAMVAYSAIVVYRIVGHVIRATAKPRCEKCRAKMDGGNPQRLEANLVHQGVSGPEAKTYVAAACLRILASDWVYFTCLKCDYVTEGQYRRGHFEKSE